MQIIRTRWQNALENVATGLTHVSVLVEDG
jgi:hypothetical protein